MVASETHDKQLDALCYLRLNHGKVLRMLPYLAQEYLLEDSNGRLKTQLLDSLDLLHVHVTLQFMHVFLA
jgi:hypothetical protein